ncbi:MAG: ABC transporter permease, partial [Vallitaleaceae bacterium]|nr:ABC transporter permease [Vallitaleaceae bacterium]
DEGYLMFTLPVQSWKHILSKLTASMLWTIASGFVALCSILIISSKDIFTPEFLKELSMVFNTIREYLGSYTSLVGFEVVVLCILSLSTTILTIYAAISLGHLFNKYKLLASFGMYIVLETVSQILMTVFIFIFWNQNILGMEVNFIPSASQINSFMLFTIFYFGAITTAYFTLTNYILKKKLNLE